MNRRIVLKFDDKNACLSKGFAMNESDFTAVSTSRPSVGVNS